MSAPTRTRTGTSRRAIPPKVNVKVKRKANVTAKGKPRAKAKAKATRKDRSVPRSGRLTSFVGGPVLDLSEPFSEDAAPKGRVLRSAKPPGRRSKSFVTLLSLIMVLNLIGLSMILSASSVSSLESYGSPWYQFIRQFIWFIMGSAVMVIAMRRDYRRWRWRCGYSVVAVMVMLVLVLIPRVGVQANGATRWLGYGQFTVQPSEFAKLALIIFWADLLSRRAKWMDDARLTVFPVAVTFMIAAALIMKQPNLGTTIIIFIIMVAMLFVVGASAKWLAAIVAGGFAAGTLFALLFPWRFRRISAFLDPWRDAQGVGYQTIESQTALATGGPTGTGLGQSRSKWGFLPEAPTDFIFAVIAEETGFIGAVLLIALFIALGVVGVRVAMRAPDRFGMLLATGITTWFLAQAFFNIGQAVGALPVMGVPLPFVSFGGSSLLVGMAASGILLNVARQTR